MARVKPFVGTRYNPKAIENLAAAMAPPYDVISPEMREALYERDPHNVVRLILGKDHEEDDEYNNKYQRAASFLKEWQSTGALMDDAEPSYYVYQQEFETPQGRRLTRTGFFGAVRLEDPSKGGIRGHEHTFDGPKADRLKLLRSTGCNLSPIFCLFSDTEFAIDQELGRITSASKPRIELTDDDGVTHRLWATSKREHVARLSQLLEDKQLLIADGHHRYETALQYCRERLDRADMVRPGHQPAYCYTLMFLTNCEAEGLVILPTHRVLSREIGEDIDRTELIDDLSQYFEMERVQVSLSNSDSESARLCTELEKRGESRRAAFCLVLPDGEGWFMQLKDSTDLREDLDIDLPEVVAQLDVSVLHRYILPQVWIGNPEIELDDQDVTYVKNAADAIEMLRPPTRAGAVFLMNAPTIEEVRAITEEHLRMPHKSTYFYPKILTGMVIRNLSTAW